MIKKITTRMLYVIAAALTSVAFAGGPDIMPAPQQPFNGLYLGAGIGITNTNYDYNVNVNTLYFNPVVNNYLPFRGVNNVGRGQSNFNGELHLGYGGVIGSRFYLGGLIGVNFTSDDDLDVSSHFENGVANNSAANLFVNTSGHLCTTEVTVDLTPGVLITPTSLFYGIIGAAFNDSKFQTTAILKASGIGFSISHTLQSEVSKNAYGLRLGLGLKQEVIEHLAFFLQYVYTAYGRASLGADQGFSSLGQTGDDPGPPDSVSIESNAHPTRQTFLVGADWFFSG